MFSGTFEKTLLHVLPHQYNLFADPIEEVVLSTFPQFEGSEIEYKSAKGGFPTSFWSTYSAFANTEGGLIVLGVKEEADHQFSPDGLTLEHARRLQQDFFNTQNNPNKISTDLLTDANVRLQQVPGQPEHYILVFDVPRATREQMPVYVGMNSATGTYKRRDGGDYRCTPPVVKRMIADSDPTVSADSRILRNFRYPDDIDQRSFQQFRQLMSSLRPDHPWLTENDLELLRMLGGYRYDRQTRQEGLTLAGLLMFGKTEAIHDPECAPEFSPDYQEALTTDPEVRWTDRIYLDGTWEANLFQFYRLVWPRLSSGLPRPFQLKNGQRQDETLAHTALREAFINSLVHADYTAPGGVTIVRRPNSFRFSNPGTLLVSIRQYYEGGVSVCRNKALQKMFGLIGGAEKAGSGAAKIVKGWESAHWMRPYLDVRDDPDRVLLELEMESILSAQTQGRLREVFGERADALFGEALTVLAIVAIEGHATHRGLKYRVSLHAADLSVLLKNLCQQGYLVASGRGSGTTYTLNESDSITRSPEVSPQGGPYPPANVETSPENVESSPQKVETSAEKVESSADATSSAKLQQVVLMTARTGWHTIAELAEATGKSGKYLINRVIPALLQAEKLERRYDAPNHPRQAYRSVL